MWNILFVAIPFCVITAVPKTKLWRIRPHEIILESWYRRTKILMESWCRRTQTVYPLYNILCWLRARGVFVGWQQFLSHIHYDCLGPLGASDETLRDIDKRLQESIKIHNVSLDKNEPIKIILDQTQILNHWRTIYNPANCVANQTQTSERRTVIYNWLEKSLWHHNPYCKNILLLSEW